MEQINIGIVGVGNCASSLLQGIQYYRTQDPKNAVGLMYWDIGGYMPYDIRVGLAFDVDERKVGLDVNNAIFQKPNCTKIFYPNLQQSGVTVQMGKVLDGVAEHMNDYPAETSFRLCSQSEPTKQEVTNLMLDSGIDILVNYLPVGSEEATRYYAECAIDAGVAFVNCMPVFIASDPQWANRFKAKNIPIIGDDIKAQLGATITHRTLVDLFEKRGVKVERSYQLNVAGNTDFLNMLDRKRLSSKKISKTEAVQSVGRIECADVNLHVGPSDYVPWQRDNKICFIRIEGRLFGDVPMDMELRLSVEDSPNSAGIVIDAIRCCKFAADRGLGGVLEGPSAYYCKHPMWQHVDSEAWNMLQEFVGVQSVADTRKVLSIQ